MSRIKEAGSMSFSSRASRPCSCFPIFHMAMFSVPMDLPVFMVFWISASSVSRSRRWISISPIPAGAKPTSWKSSCTPPWVARISSKGSRGMVIKIRARVDGEFFSRACKPAPRDNTSCGWMSSRSVSGRTVNFAAMNRTYLSRQAWPVIAKIKAQRLKSQKVYSLSLEEIQPVKQGSENRAIFIWFCIEPETRDNSL